MSDMLPSVDFIRYLTSTSASAFDILPADMDTVQASDMYPAGILEESPEESFALSLVRNIVTFYVTRYAEEGEEHSEDELVIPPPIDHPILDILTAEDFGFPSNSIKLINYNFAGYGSVAGTVRSFCNILQFGDHIDPITFLAIIAAADESIMSTLLEDPSFDNARSVLENEELSTALSLYPPEDPEFRAFMATLIVATDAMMDANEKVDFYARTIVDAVEFAGANGEPCVTNIAPGDQGNISTPAIKKIKLHPKELPMIGCKNEMLSTNEKIQGTDTMTNFLFFKLYDDCCPTKMAMRIISNIFLRDEDLLPESRAFIDNLPEGLSLDSIKEDPDRIQKGLRLIRYIFMQFLIWKGLYEKNIEAAACFIIGLSRDDNFKSWNPLDIVGNMARLGFHVTATIGSFSELCKNYLNIVPLPEYAGDVVCPMSSSQAFFGVVPWDVLIDLFGEKSDTGKDVIQNMFFKIVKRSGIKFDDMEAYTIVANPAELNIPWLADTTNEPIPLVFFIIKSSVTVRSRKSPFNHAILMMEELANGSYFMKGEKPAGNEIFFSMVPFEEENWFSFFDDIHCSGDVPSTSVSSTFLPSLINFVDKVIDIQNARLQVFRKCPVSDGVGVYHPDDDIKNGALDHAGDIEDPIDIESLVDLDNALNTFRMQPPGPQVQEVDENEALGFLA